MQNFLYEELSEVESIYRSIKTQLADICKLSELKEVVQAIRNEINAGIEDLEWIKLNLELMQSKSGMKLYKEFYTTTLRGLYTVKYRAVILDRLVSIIIYNTYIKHNKKYGEATTALEKFVNNVKVHLKDARKLKFYTFIEYEYSTITILDDYNIIAFCTPSYDILKPWKWTLLLHEIGHTMFNAKIDTYVMKFREKILPILRDLAPSSVRTQVAAYLKLWEQKWLKEFVSDLYGVTVGGPAYIYAFMIEVFESDPAQYAPTHPSLDSRIYLQFRYLDEINEIKELVDKVEDLWYTHRDNIITEELGYPFPQSALDKLVYVFMDLIRRPVYLDLSGRVVELQQQIDKGIIVEALPLPLILALTLSRNRRKKAIQQKVIKIIAANQ